LAELRRVRLGSGCIEVHAVKERRLCVVANPGVNDPADFTLLAELVGSIDGTIDVAVCIDGLGQRGRDATSSLPTLTFSPGPLQYFGASRGPVFQGRLLPKSEEYRRLEAARIPVPRWAPLTMDQQPNCADLGANVVVKPDLGAQGAEVVCVRATRVRWKPPATRTARVLGGPFAGKLVQEFIYTGRWPVSYRVVTLFAQVLWCLRVEAARTRTPLSHRNAFAELRSGEGLSIVSSGRGCTYASSHEPEILALGQQAHLGFPEIGLLGVDILRDADSGKLYVVEVNSLGHVWLVSSRKGRLLQAQFGIDIDAEWGATRNAASVMAGEVRARAC
jgi:hypothetical protein